MGGISPELMEQAKAAMLAENMDFSEQSEPSARSGAGYPSTGGFIEQHFDFAQAAPDLAGLNKQLKAAKVGLESGRKNSSKERVAGLRAQIKKKLKLDKIAAQDTLGLAKNIGVYHDPRGDNEDSYAEEGDTQDFTTCQRPDGSKYGSPGRCIKGSETSPASKDDKKGSSKTGGGGPKPQSGNTRATSSTPKGSMNKADKANAEKASAIRKIKADKGPAVKEADKRAKDLNKEANRMQKAFERQKKTTDKNPTKENKARLKEIQRQTKMADKAAKQADKKANKLANDMNRDLTKIDKQKRGRWF